jgi:hypothetical protein
MPAKRKAKAAPAAAEEVDDAPDALGIVAAKKTRTDAGDSAGIVAVETPKPANLSLGKLFKPGRDWDPPIERRTERVDAHVDVRMLIDTHILGLRWQDHRMSAYPRPDVVLRPFNFDGVSRSQ